MVDMIGVGTCTPTSANVCLGSETNLMELDKLTLAEYRASSAATFPAEFGACVMMKGQTRASLSVDIAPSLDAEFAHVVQPADDVTQSSGYSNISESAYDMVNK